MKSPASRRFAFYRSRWLYKLVGAFVLAITLPVTAVSFRASLRERENNVAREVSELNATSRRIAGDIDRYLTLNQNIVRYLAVHSELKSLVRAHEPQGGSSRFNQWLQEQAEISTECAALYVLRTDGTCIASTEPAFLNQNYGIRYYFREAMKGKVYKSDWTVGLTSKEPGIYLSSPISEDNGILGVLVLKVRVDQIVRLASSWKSESRDTIILNEAGVVLFHTQARFQYNSIDALSDEEKRRLRENRQFAELEKSSLDLPSLRVGLARALQSGQTEVVDYLMGDTPKLASLTPLREEKWAIVATVPKEVIYASSEPVLRDTILFGLLSVGAAAALGLFINRSFAKPILTIANNMRSFGSGDATVRAAREGTNEIGYLTESFNAMAEAVSGRYVEYDSQLWNSQRRVEELQLQLHARTERDILTGCFGRPYLFEHLGEEIGKCRRTGESLALVACSIDDLRSVNERFGHLAGDSVLQTVAGMLIDVTRREIDWVARYDGCGFMIVLPQYKLDPALKLAKRLRDRVVEHVFDVGVQQGPKVSISLGVVTSKCTKDSAPSPDKLVAQAINLIYAAQGQGGGHILDRVIE